MAKINFSKVEDALAEGLRKMKVHELCELADIVSGKQKFEAEDIDRLSQKYAIFIRKLKINLDRLYRKDKKIYSKLKIKRKELELSLQTPEKLEKQDWINLMRLYKRSEEAIKEYFPQTTDEELIEQEQLKHINKRFNVNDDWLPLH